MGKHYSKEASVPCEIARVHFFGPHGEEAFVEVPAYTRDPDEMQDVIYNHWVDYLQGSTRDNQGLSLADFAIYLLSQAAQEPKEMRL